MAFIDFAELKARVSFEQVVNLLGLQVKKAGHQWRGACPSCRSGGDRALVITDGKGWYCFAAQAGGDQLALVSHIKDLPVKEAALIIAQHLGIHTGTSSSSTSKSKSTVPESVTSKGTQKPQLEAYFDKLDQEHPALDALGFSPEFVKQHRIGFAKSGIIGGTVAIPFRDENGTLLGFIGIIDCKLPADFTTNVIPFNKTA